MCGITGVWGERNEPLVRNMMELLAHRGPDDDGIHEKGMAGTLGHRRLSIMDPQGGEQPIYNENRSLAIVANGEIYNFRALRADLEKAHRFNTTSDTEVVLHLYEECGPEAVQRLDGMFALAVADDDSIFLARDPIGIKPLYYGVRDEGGPREAFYFASELKALTDKGVTVEEFPPGTYYHSDTGFVPFYRVPERSPRKMPLDYWLKTVRAKLEEAVVKRLMSDVPLGAFLSGGLDSSLIAAIARRHMGELHTFAVGVEGSSDIEAARVAARYLDTTHHEYIYTAEEVTEKLPEIIYHLESFDQYLVRSAIPCYFCSRLASDYVKVILTGEGADELFAGYKYYKGFHNSEALHRELRRSVVSLHHSNLQRVDRLTMAHSIEGRVPFLDVEMIDLAQEIPPELKLRNDGSRKLVEKWILRKACEDLLPPELLWRDKEKFGEGSGTIDMLEGLLSEQVDDSQASRHIRANPRDNLRSAEEAFYHEILVDVYGPSDVILDNVGRTVQRAPSPA